jgi:hypothetical protein
MSSFVLEGTRRTPKIVLDPSRGLIEFVGESLPEDLRGFYDPVLERLDAMLEYGSSETIEAVFEFVYFNSGSARIISDVISRLDDAAKRGRGVRIIWVAEEDDDTMREYAEDFSVRLSHTRLEVLARRENV